MTQFSDYLFKQLDDSPAGAVFGPGRTHRYVWWRAWFDPKKKRDPKRLLFVMLNPSKADEDDTDPTCYKVVKYAKAWHFDAVDVVNLFALVSTNPRALYTAHANGDDLIGEMNDAHILDTAKRAYKIVLGWGNHGSLVERDVAVLELLKDYKLYCLGINKDGSPEHPLYLADATIPRPYARPTGASLEANNL